MDLNSIRKQASDYATALDLLSKITQSCAVNETVNNILELFTMLFSPGKLSYVSVMDDQSGQMHSVLPSMKEDAVINDFVGDSGKRYTWAASGNGFLIKIRHNGNLLGVLVVDEIGFPEYKEHYLNLSLTISDVCGLAIENARRYQQIKNSEDQLRKEKEKVEEALSTVNKLSGLLPICSFCKKIRDDKGYWKQIETYIKEHSEADFSHSICKDCANKHYPDLNIYND
jgi:hypothetical protein